MDAYQTISRLGQGRLIEMLADAVERTSEEVVASGTAGTVTLKLKITPFPGGGPVCIAIEEQISRQTPTKKPLSAVLFSVDGELHREDPREIKMQFETIDTTTGEIRTVDEPTPEMRHA